MSTNFPTSLDSYSARTAGQTIASAHVNNLQDAVAALEAKVGVNSSAVTSSLDYKVANISAAAYGPRPSLNGWKDWTADPALISSQALAVVSGTLFGTGFTAGAANTFTTVTVRSTNTGTATAAYAALYSSAGSLIVQSSDSSGQFGSSGLKTFTFASTALTAGTNYYLALWVVSGSPPSFNQPGTDLDSWANLGLGSSTYRCFSANTGLSSTAPSSLGTRTAARGLWAAFS